MHLRGARNSGVFALNITYGDFLLKTRNLHIQVKKLKRKIVVLNNDDSGRNKLKLCKTCMRYKNICQPGQIV